MASHLRVEAMDASDNLAGYATLTLVLLGAAHVALHHYTSGRSGPIVGATFALGGPVLGVLLVVGVLVGEASSSEEVLQASRAHRANHGGFVFGFEVAEYAVCMLSVGLALSLVAGVIYAGMIGDQIRALREDGRGDRPHPVAVPSLHGLGLPPWATLEEVEQAYRELAKTTHPDVGGDEVRFKRLQRNYELAKRHLAKRRQVGPSRR